MSMDGSIEPVQEGDDRRGGGRHRIARLVVNFTLLAVAALTIGIAAYFPGYLKDIDKTLAGLLSNDKTSAAPIKVAFVGALSGPSRAADTAILNGAQIAMDEINALGGISGRPLVIEAFDDAGDEDKASTVSEQIGERSDIVAVIGHGSSLTSRAAAPNYQLYKVPAVTPTATNPNVTKLNTWYFRIIFNDDLQGKVLAHYIRSVLGYQSVAIVHDTTPYSRTLANVFTDTAERIALNVGQSFTVPDDPADPLMRDIARQISLMNRLESVLLLIKPEQAQHLVPLLRSMGSKADFVGSDVLSQIAFPTDRTDDASARAPPYMEGMLVTVPFLAASASARARHFLQGYEEKFKVAAAWPAVFGYDSALAIAEAVRRAGPSFKPEAPAEARQAIRDQLAAMNAPELGLSGLTGLIYFTDGDVTRPVYLARVQQGQLVPAPQQLDLVENPKMVEVLREEGENTIDFEGIFLRITTVVKTGIRINSISRVDNVAKKYTADFDVCFRYRGKFDPREIVFSNAITPITLGKPEISRVVGGEKYELFKVKGEFGYTVKAADVRTGAFDFNIEYYHPRRDLTRLVFLPDLTAMGATSQHWSWADALRAHGVIDAVSGWVVEGATVSQEIFSRSTLGDPLMPMVELPFSAFRASVGVRKGEVSIRNYLDAILPQINSWIVLVFLVALLVVVLHPAMKRHAPLPTTLIRLILGTLIFYVFESVIFDWAQKRLEIYQLQIVSTLFESLWWLVPAVWVISLLPVVLWSPMERRTGYPVSAIARTGVNVAVLLVAGTCIVAFVFDQPVTSVWAASGVVTVVLGIALQSLILDAFAGLMLSAERPFSIGDWVALTGPRVQSPDGRVEEMNWRTTRLWTRDNNTLVIPNSAIAQATVVNYSVYSRASRLNISIVLESDVPVPEALAVLIKGAQEAVASGRILADPPPRAVVDKIESFGIRYKVQVHHDMAVASRDAATTEVVGCLMRHLAKRGIRAAWPKEQIAVTPGPGWSSDSKAGVSVLLEQSTAAAE
jgi:potassium-dependent mechanosensitive channel